LWSIAKAKLGSAERYKEITAANRLLIGTLEPGQKLRLPDQKR
jgi:nucleoid-associated protein YgaU